VQNEQHLRWDLHEVNNRLERIMKNSFSEVLETKLQRKVSMRIAANVIGIARVVEANKARGLYP
jgi:glutamate dehydrogenase/leucine dehydrogenase